MEDLGFAGSCFDMKRVKGKPVWVITVLLETALLNLSKTKISIFKGWQLPFNSREVVLSSGFGGIVPPGK